MANQFLIGEMLLLEYHEFHHGYLCVHKLSFCNLRKAKLLLRKKRFQENMIEKTDNQLENIERMVRLYFSLPPVML